jgi:hypothetical protein
MSSCATDRSAPRSKSATVQDSCTRPSTLSVDDAEVEASNTWRLVAGSASRSASERSGKSASAASRSRQVPRLGGRRERPVAASSCPSRRVAALPETRQVRLGGARSGNQLGEF